MKLWIGNVSSDTTSEELQSLLRKYGVPGFDDMLQVPGDGSRPGVLLTFGDVSAELLHGIAHRLNGMYWKHRGLTVRVMQH
jgi:hypothetical protein